MAKVEQDTVSAFGEAVRATRIRKGWYQPDLDEAMQGGIDKSHLSAIENGRRKGLSPVTVSRLVTALGMDPSWLEHWIPGGLEKATARADAVLQKAQETDAFAEMRKHNISENEIIELAQTTAFEIEDLGQAWQELTNFVEMAVRVQKEGRGGSNHGGFVDEVLARVAEFSREGEYASASDAIDEALKRAEAEQVRLLESGVEVALLARDTEKAAQLLIRKANIEAGGAATIGALRGIWNHYFEIGSVKGRNLEGRLAIDLAHLLLARAVDRNERHLAGDYLGLSLMELGKRDSNTARLEQAAAAFTEALKEFTHDDASMAAAMTKTNLGNALLSLGESNSGTGFLEKAVTVYTDALKVITRDRVPLDWAKALVNLGVAQKEIGSREGGTDRLEQAVFAYTEALKVFTRDRFPMEWAVVQLNLGVALKEIGLRQEGTDRLEQAVIAFEKALQVFNRSGVPMDWAITKVNLGNVLLVLWEREGGTDRLELATTAFTEALEEFTRVKAPKQWAIVQSNLANVEVAIFDKTGDESCLNRAWDQITAVLEVFAEAGAGADRYVGIAEDIKAAIQSRRDAF